MLRLTPPQQRLIADTESFDACYGGSEYNVLVALSSLGHPTRMLTAVPDNPLGTAVIRRMQSYGIDSREVLRHGDRLGMYFLEEGFGPRTPQVIYCRRDSEVSRLGKDAFTFDEIFRDCGLFHISGISFALSESCRQLCFQLLEEARARQIPISFDFNYRSKLWSTEEAAEVYKKIVPYVDYLFCSERDLTTFLETDIDHFYEKYETACLIVRERKIFSADTQSVQASIYSRQQNAAQPKHFQTPERTFHVLERIGSGDAFAAGVLHGLLKAGMQPSEEDLQNALEAGISCFILKHTIKGDVLSVTASQLENFQRSRNENVNR